MTSPEPVSKLLVGVGLGRVRKPIVEPAAAAGTRGRPLPAGLGDRHAAPLWVAGGDAALAAVDHELHLPRRVPQRRVDAAVRAAPAPVVLRRGLAQAPAGAAADPAARQALGGIVEEAELRPPALQVVAAARLARGGHR